MASNGRIALVVDRTGLKDRFARTDNVLDRPERLVDVSHCLSIRLPIMRIFTALFFIETDYIATLLNPYFLDFERGWILCIVALWNTFKPSCTAAKHRSVNFLLPAHPHPDDIAHRRIAPLKGFQGRLTDHSTISHHSDLSQQETLSHPLDYRYESFDICRVARPHLAANRSALDVQGHANDHLVKIGPVILIVAPFTD